MDKMQILNKIFRAYDIRGKYPDEVTPERAYVIARETARFLEARTLVVGMDARSGSKKLAAAVIRGLEDDGVAVQFIGETTTPMFYFAVSHLGADGGIIVTASHNPKNYNGFKIVGRDAQAIGMENGLEVIFSAVGTYFAAETPSLNLRPLPEVQPVTEAYVDLLLAYSGFRPKTDANGTLQWEPDPSGLHIGIDASNGMAGVILPELLKRISFKHIPLSFNVDGTFPDHGPDPMKSESTAALQAKIREEKLDLGVMFDGDADRIIFLDADGEVIPSSLILLLLAGESTTGAGVRVVYTATMSRAIPEFVVEWNGEAIRSRVGHTFINRMMRKRDALLGAEESGHYYFKEMQYSESALLAMLRVLSVVARTGRPLGELAGKYQKYASSGEINFPLEHDIDKNRVLRALEERFSDATIEKLDGLTVTYEDPVNPGKVLWWFNIRPSNTESMVRLNMEAETKELLDQKVKELTDMINSVSSGRR